MIVRVKGKGVKLNGKWYYKNDEAVIDETEYQENKNFVDIIKDEEGPKLPQVPNKDETDPEEKELLELRMKAKELGIKNAHFMKKENLENAIAEKTAPLFGEKSDKGEDAGDNPSDSENSGKEDPEGKENPQE